MIMRLTNKVHAASFFMKLRKDLLKGEVGNKGSSFKALITKASSSFEAASVANAGLETIVASCNELMFVCSDPTAQIISNTITNRPSHA
jgi:hypothetical protein